MTPILVLCAFLVSGYSSFSQTDIKLRHFKARNGVEFDYLIKFPADFDPNKSYDAVISFSSMRYDKNQAYDNITRLWTNNDWIVVVPMAPESGRNGWINHPAHHGLEDFMKSILKKYKISKDQFHLVGFRDGAVPAQTYVEMSSPFFRSLVIMSSTYWDHYEISNYRKIRNLEIPFILLYGEKDEKGRNYAENVVKQMKAVDGRVQYEVVSGADQYLTEILNAQFNKLLINYLSFW